MKGLFKIVLLGALFIVFIAHVDSFAGARSALPVVHRAEIADLYEVQDDFAEAIENDTEEVKKAMADFYAVESAVELAIADAQQEYEDGGISAVRKAQIVGEERYKLAQAMYKLNMIRDQSINNVKAQKTYFDRFKSSVGVVGAKLKNFYYSYDDTAKAAIILEQLEKDRNEILQAYKKDLQNASGEQKKQLRDAIRSIRQEFEEEIKKQRIIFENYLYDAKGFGTKAFWKVVGISGAVLAGAVYSEPLCQDTKTYFFFKS